MPALRWVTRKRLIVLGAIAAGYILIWCITHFVGVPSVYRTVEDSMPITAEFHYTDVRRKASGGTDWPRYYCYTVAYAPFLVRADYGWQSGSLSGDGGSGLYLWLPGYTVRIVELGHWSS